MRLGSPIGAMLWENWRLSRVEAAQRLGLGLAAASLALVLNSRNGATIALWALIVAHGFFWFSIAKLNGGRFADGYKPGFPLYLLYTRPVRTAVFVGVTMAYDAVSCAVLYLVSAAFLGFVFGKPLPLVSVAACLVAYHLASTCIQWSTRSRIFQWVGSMLVFWPLVALLRSGLASPEGGLTLAQYALLVIICAASFGFTVAGVARQRRGDAVAIEPRTGLGSGYPPWLLGLFRFSCPTSSATRAQLWFELRSSGLPVLTIGLGAALLIFLLYAIGIVIPPVRLGAIGLSLGAGPILLLLSGSNAFGIRGKQGRLYASAFLATQPYGTAPMAGLKVMVRAACILAALVLIGASAWASSSLMSVWGSWMVEGVDLSARLFQQRQQILDVVRGQSGHAYVAQAIVACIAIAAVVAWQAAREALKARYPRRLLLIQWLPAIWGCVITLMALAANSGIVSASAAGSAIGAAVWIATAALVLATSYFLWRALAERALPGGYVAGALALLAAFAVAYGSVLRDIGVPNSETHPTAVAILLWPVLLLLLGSTLAPWSLNRVRHT
jgi:hypothetical protein